MKKLLNKLEPSSSSIPSTVLPAAAVSATAGGSQQILESKNSLIGKTYKLDKGSVVIVEDVIAEGGFGIVFLVKLLQPPGGAVQGGVGGQGGIAGAAGGQGKLLAMKRLVVNNEQDLAVANREVAIMSSLGRECSYILSCIDSMTSRLDSEVYEILSLSPYCKANLLQMLQKSQSTKSPLKEVEVLKILSDICQGLARLHGCTTPIIHRDLKIENILHEDGKFIICDFGSATGKFWDPENHSVHHISEELEKYTTLAYRAPEMVDLYSQRGVIGTKSDVWALGVAVFKMLYLTTPFGDSILSIQSGRFEFPSTPIYSKRLQELISWMLEVDQTVRPDVFQVAHLVHNLLDTPNPVTNLHNSPPLSFEEVLKIRNDRPVVTVGPVAVGVPVGAIQPVLLETSVTPRQRPRVGGAAAVMPLVVPQVTTNATEGLIIQPPPKSPKPDARKIHGAGGALELELEEEEPPLPTDRVSLPPLPAVAPQPTTDPVHSSGSTASWNPFACSSPTTEDPLPDQTAQTATSSSDTSDPFALAPFDFFKYQPMICTTRLSSSVATTTADVFAMDPFSNPFLEFHDPPPPTDDDHEHQNNNNNNSQEVLNSFNNYSFQH